MAPTTPVSDDHNYHHHPLCEKIPIKNYLDKAIDLTTLLLLFSLLLYRLLHLSYHGLPWLLALLCESWFTFEFFLHLNAKWTPVHFKPRPQTLLQREGAELPAVDLFVTTADAVLEPPIMTVNTVLSLLAVEYPTHKLACYVSDDGGSAIILYSLIEASKFARLWVPFCKKYKVQVRVPFRYFSNDDDAVSPSDGDINALEFHLEWKKIKEEYEKLKQKIEEAMERTVPFEFTEEYAGFANIDKSDHPSIIKVIWENKEKLPDSLPHLVYVCREKRPITSHHYKAGAMNVLTRVSGVMTNAPFMLNVDCDMFANNPKILVFAMCFFLDLKPEDCAFVQFPQAFYNELKDDPFGNQSAVALETFWPGTAGIQGPVYAGTGCFHRRKLIYGFSLNNADNKALRIVDDETLLNKPFGNSLEFMDSVTKTFSGPMNGKNDTIGAQDLSSTLKAAHEVAQCDYEDGTAWGSKVGWKYGSMTEDVLTGMKIHAMGWRSVCCMPKPPGFLGNRPTSGPTVMTQMKRWIAGLLQILFSKNSVIFATLNSKLQFRQYLLYISILIWGLRSIPALCYAVLPAYCILTNSHYLPKAHEPIMVVFVAQFLLENGQNLRLYLRCGQSIRAWWNNLRMTRISAVTSMLFGVLSLVFKLLGISEIVFEVTQKESNDSSSSSTNATNNNTDNEAAKAGRFTFDESPVLVPATTLLFLQLTALGLSLLEGGVRDRVGLGEYLASAWVVMCFWPFMRGLFGQGKYGIPLSTLLKSAGFAFIFVTLCRQASAIDRGSI